MSGGAIEWKTICRKLARKPTHRGFSQWNKSTPQKTKQLEILQLPLLTLSSIRWYNARMREFFTLQTKETST